MASFTMSLLFLTTKLLFACILGFLYPIYWLRVRITSLLFGTTNRKGVSLTSYGYVVFWWTSSTKPTDAFFFAYPIGAPFP